MLSVTKILYKDFRKHVFLSCSYYDKYKVSTKHFLSALITQSKEHAIAEWE